MDLAEAEVDDATVREELGRKKQMKPKAAFANGAGLDSLVQRSASSLGVVTLFSAKGVGRSRLVVSGDNIT